MNSPENPLGEVPRNAQRQGLALLRFLLGAVDRIWASGCLTVLLVLAASTVVAKGRDRILSTEANVMAEVQFTTNYTELGGATNSLARFYRIVRYY